MKYKLREGWEFVNDTPMYSHWTCSKPIPIDGKLRCEAPAFIINAFTNSGDSGRCRQHIKELIIEEIIEKPKSRLSFI